MKVNASAREVRISHCIKGAQDDGRPYFTSGFTSAEALVRSPKACLAVHTEGRQKRRSTGIAVHSLKGLSLLHDTSPPSRIAPATSITHELVKLLAIALPIAAGQLLTILMGVVDTRILGYAAVEGSAEFGGASTGRSIGFTCLVFAMGIAGACDTLSAQALGAGDEQEAWIAFKSSLRIALLWAVPCAIVAISITRLLPLFGIERELARHATRFTLGQLPSMFFIVGFSATKGYLSARHRTFILIASAIAANIINVPVCNVLVRGDAALASVGLPGVGIPPLGSLGAGIALSIASLVQFLVVFAYAKAVAPANAVGSIDAKRVMRLGLPNGLHLVAEYSAFALVTVLAAKCGRAEVGAHQVAIILASFTYMGAHGIGGATSARVGRAIGAGASPRMPGMLGIALGLLFMGACAAIFAIAPQWLTLQLTPDRTVIPIAVKLLYIAACFQLFDGVQVVASSALRGTGDTRAPFIATLLAYWGFAIPVGYWLGVALKMGAIGLWWGLTVGLVVVAVVLLVRFWQRSGRLIARV